MFRPCETLAAVAVIWSAGGSGAVFVYVAVLFFRGAGDAAADAWLGALSLVAAGLFAGVGVWACGPAASR